MRNGMQLFVHFISNWNVQRAKDVSLFPELKWQGVTSEVIAAINQCVRSAKKTNTSCPVPYIGTFLENPLDVLPLGMELSALSHTPMPHHVFNAGNDVSRNALVSIANYANQVACDGVSKKGRCDVWYCVCCVCIMRKMLVMS